MSAKDEFDGLLAKVIHISSAAKSKVRGSIRHNTEDVGIEVETREGTHQLKRRRLPPECPGTDIDMEDI